MIPEKMLKFGFEQMKWQIQIEYWHGIPKCWQPMKIGMSGVIVQMAGNNQSVAGTGSCVGRTEINIILNIELSSW